jgi:hypothetical protein
MLFILRHNWLDLLENFHLLNEVRHHRAAIPRGA